MRMGPWVQASSDPFIGIGAKDFGELLLSVGPTLDIRGTVAREHRCVLPLNQGRLTLAFWGFVLLKCIF